MLSDLLPSAPARLLKLGASRADKKRMAVHVICPSLRCRKILSFGDDVRGANVTCRYCQMQFRVPQLRRSSTAGGAATTSTPSTSPHTPHTPPVRPSAA